MRIFSMEFLAALPRGILSDLINVSCTAYSSSLLEELLLLLCLYSTPMSLLHLIFHMHVFN